MKTLKKLKKRLECESNPNKHGPGIIQLMCLIERPEEYATCLEYLAAKMDINSIRHGTWGLAPVAARHADKGRLSWQWPLLHQAGVDLNASGGQRDASRANGYYPLILAAIGGSASDIELLLSFGAEVNCLGDFDRTALFEANPATANALIKAGININHRDSEGYSALFFRASLADRKDGQDIEVMRLLISEGALLTPPDQHVDLAPEAAEIIRAARDAGELQKRVVTAASGPKVRL